MHVYVGKYYLSRNPLVCDWTQHWKATLRMDQHQRNWWHHQNRGRDERQVHGCCVAWQRGGGWRHDCSCMRYKRITSGKFDNFMLSNIIFEQIIKYILNRQSWIYNPSTWPVLIEIFYQNHVFGKLQKKTYFARDHFQIYSPRTQNHKMLFGKGLKWDTKMGVALSVWVTPIRLYNV